MMVSYSEHAVKYKLHLAFNGVLSVVALRDPERAINNINDRTISDRTTGIKQRLAEAERDHRERQN